jgi:F-type H+-transporting ATPase subunit b
MKFDPWTFVFQIINFGVLLLILKRVLYKPVREIMEKRRALAVRTQQEAENALREAQELQAKNQAEMQTMQAQRARMIEEMKTEVAQQRQKLLAEADLEVQRHIDKKQALFANEKARLATEVKEQAADTVLQYATNILKDIADVDLHRALCRRLVDEMENLGVELRGETGPDGVLNVNITSAYPLCEEEELSLREGLENTTGCRVNFNTIIDQELLAGVKLLVSDRCYDASLNGQLVAFTTKLRENV